MSCKAVWYLWFFPFWATMETMGLAHNGTFFWDVSLCHWVFNVQHFRTMYSPVPTPWNLRGEEVGEGEGKTGGTYEASTRLWHEMSVKNTSPKYISCYNIRNQESHSNVSDTCFCIESSCWIIIHTHQVNTHPISCPHSLNTFQVFSYQKWTKWPHHLQGWQFLNDNTVTASVKKLLWEQDASFLSARLEISQLPKKNMVTVWKNTIAGFTHLHLPPFRKITAVTYCLTFPPTSNCHWRVQVTTQDTQIPIFAHYGAWLFHWHGKTFCTKNNCHLHRYTPECHWRKPYLLASQTAELTAPFAFLMHKA